MQSILQYEKLEILDKGDMTPNKVKQFDRHIESVLASLVLLDCFLEEPKLSIKRIVELTGMTRNRVSRILGTLIYKGYLMEAVEQNNYTPGPKLLALGNIFEENQNLVVLSRSKLKELALKTGETASFCIREGTERVVLAKEDGTDAVRVSVDVGTRVPLHLGAIGKVLLAFVSKTEQSIILTSKNLVAATPQTIIEPNVLMQQLEDIIKSGYAVSKGERTPHAFAIAAPVFERKNQIVGVIAVAGPISKLTPEREEKYIADVVVAAKDLSEEFGCVFS